MDFLGEASLALRRGARGARRGRPELSSTRASCAAWTLQPDRIRVDHRPARRPGNGLRRPATTGAVPEQLGGKPTPAVGWAWASSACCCCSRRSARPSQRRPDAYADRAGCRQPERGDGHLRSTASRPSVDVLDARHRRPRHEIKIAAPTRKGRATPAVFGDDCYEPRESLVKPLRGPPRSARCRSGRGRLGGESLRDA